jgi:hypothetical protein
MKLTFIVISAGVLARNVQANLHPADGPEARISSSLPKHVTFPVAFARAVGRKAIAAPHETETVKARTSAFLQQRQAPQALVTQFSAEAFERAEALDTLLLECEDLRSSSERALADIQLRLSDTRSGNTENIGEGINADNAKSQAEEAVNLAQETASAAFKQCEDETASYRDVIQKMVEDLRATANLSTTLANFCSQAAEGNTLFLLQETQSLTSGIASIAPVEQGLQDLLRKLKTNSARSEIQTAFKRLYHQGALVDSSVVQRHRIYRQHRICRQHRISRRHRSRRHRRVNEVGSLPAMPNQEIMPTSTKCRLKLVQCEAMAIELKRLVGKLQEQLRDKALEQRSHEEQCTSSRRLLTKELDASRNRME